MHDQTVSRKDFIRLGALSAAAWYVGGCRSNDGRQFADTAAESAAGTAAAPHERQAQAGLDTTFTGPAFVNGVENLKYSNPFRQHLAPVWIHGKKAFHLNLGAVNQKPAYPIAEQYLPLRASDYPGSTATPEAFMSQARKLVGSPVFDSQPGDDNYSPIWHNNWVLVPADYTPDTLRSVEDVRKSGYRIVPTPIWVN